MDPWLNLLRLIQKRREYAQAQLLERCVVWAPPKTNGEAIQRRMNREMVEGFLAKCQSDFLSGWRPHE